MIITIGSVSMGLVWGWLLILIGHGVSARRPFRNTLALILATLILSWQLFLFTDWRQTVIFLGTAVIGLSTHLAWRNRLQSEANHS